MSSYRRNRHTRSLFILGIILILSCLSAALFLHKPAEAASEADARAFADRFCPGGGPEYEEMRIADYMWATNPSGGTNLSAFVGQNSVPIKIHFFVTYCKEWGNWNDGATDLRLYEDVGTKRQRLSGLASPNISYGGTAIQGQRSTWGTVSFDATLDISGWTTTRPHTACTAFTTTSNKPLSIFSNSPSACFQFTLTRVNRWDVTEKQAFASRTTPGPVKRGSTITDGRVGERYEFRYEWQNDGPNATGNVDFMRRYAYPNASQGWTKFGSTRSNIASGLDVFNGTPGNTGTIPASAAGQRYCMQTGVQPPAWNISTRREGRDVCVIVPFNYNLTPGVAGPGGQAVVGTPIPPVSPSVNNTVPGAAGLTTNSAPVKWEMWRVEIPPGFALPIATQNNLAPCAYYQPSTACEDKGSGTQVFVPGLTDAPELPEVTGETIRPNTPVGTRVCYTLSVQPYSHTSTDWRHSAPSCITVSKLPKVQVWGHDVRTRGSIETSTSRVNSGGDKVFGSWVEYGGFSVRGNSGFASGSGLNEGNTSVLDRDVWNRLTFANINNSGASDYGNYALPTGLPTITAQFIGAPAGGGFNSNLGALASGTYVTEDVTIDTSDVGLGKSIIIVSSGTVRINGNITYSGSGAGDSFTSVNQLPQVVIVARNINITNAATQVDAWLLTTSGGAINTCIDRTLTQPLTSNVCNATLTVNGPVVTDHLYLRRTAGSDGTVDAGNPAEVFNLRPDAFMWAYGRTSQAGKAQTVYSVELPPRF